MAYEGAFSHTLAPPISLDGLLFVSWLAPVAAVAAVAAAAAALAFPLLLLVLSFELVLALVLLFD
jgi:hypothetical protein